MKEKNQWEEIGITSDIVTAPGAASDLVVHEFTHEAKIEAIEISAGEANWFKVIEREHDGSNPSTIRPGPLRLKGDGQLIYKETFDNPITTIQANKEIAVQNVNAGSAGVNYSVSIKAWVRRG